MTSQMKIDLVSKLKNIAGAALPLNHREMCVLETDET
jgi:hypothetical protein